jgi:hypothetical protein
MVQMRDEQLKHETEARLDEADGPAELTARMGPPPRSLRSATRQRTSDASMRAVPSVGGQPAPGPDASVRVP